MPGEEVEVPVHFRCQGEVYRGRARFYAKWFHIYVTGRRLKTGGWDYGLARKEMGDDKFEIGEAQLDELLAGRSVQVDFGYEDPITVHPGDYAPEPDDREQMRFL